MSYIIPLEFTESQMRRLEEVHAKMQERGNYKAAITETASAAAFTGLDELERIFGVPQKKLL